MIPFRWRWVVAATAATTAAAAASATLGPGQSLLPGDHITSGNGYLAMQPSGVLAVCAAVAADGSCSSKVLWSTVTDNPATPVAAGSKALMAQYGVLEVHSPDGTRLWWTHTMAAAGCTPTSTDCAYVAMQEDGNCVLRAGTPAHPKGAGAALWTTATKLPPRDAKNVLHFIVDDLRPAMKAAYKQEYMITPAFDRLATEGLVFLRAYTGIAVCAPSRNSFMSGLRPDITGIFNFNNHIREPGQPNIVTMPQQFREAGYTVLGGGKTFHYNVPPYFDDTGVGGTWSSEVQAYFPFLEFSGSHDMATCPIAASTLCVIDGDEYSQLYDYRLMNHTIATLQTVAARTAPWYVMAGFRRPHRNWKVHRKYWDLYGDASTFATAKHKTRDPSQPLIAFHPAAITLENGTTYPGDPDHPWPDEVQQIARKGYATAVTQTDAYVGMVMDALDATGQADKTIVLLHADHGWQLGEHGLWDKQTEFELATRVPLIVKVPWKAASAGKRTMAFAELVDLHPTLAALAGLPFTAPTALPAAVAAQGTGIDLSPVFDDPALVEAQPGKNASFSQWPVCTRNISKMCMACTGPLSSRVRILTMGYSIRTDTFRYTVWLPLNTTTFTGNFAVDPLAAELYDHRNSSVYDFDLDGETHNIVDDPRFADVASMLHRLVQRQYTWDEPWLLASREKLVAGQRKFDLNMGFTPYADGEIPVPPAPGSRTEL
mmetsp:Transcript_30119/g.90213  ORF Transcript_30119/g.90213 Transcript_30119/m.90213 type:complete len:714 (-) Transcript_30119:137-2278(-)